MSSKIKKAQKSQDRIKELEAENARLRKDLAEAYSWLHEDDERRREFNEMYKGG